VIGVFFIWINKKGNRHNAILNNLKYFHWKCSLKWFIQSYLVGVDWMWCHTKKYVGFWMKNYFLNSKFSDKFKGWTLIFKNFKNFYTKKIQPHVHILGSRPPNFWKILQFLKIFKPKTTNPSKYSQSTSLSKFQFIPQTDVIYEQPHIHELIYHINQNIIMGKKINFLSRKKKKFL
jgi:hypothetical protein